MELEIISEDGTGIRSFIQLIRGHNLDLTCVELLLSMSDGEPPKDMQTHAKNIGVAASSVTHAVARLEKRGLAQRKCCPVHSRTIRPVLTEEGRHLTNELLTYQ